jgi:hypothetical protein
VDTNPNQNFLLIPAWQGFMFTAGTIACLASRIHKVSAKGSSSITPLEALKASDSLSVKGCSDV